MTQINQFTSLLEQLAINKEGVVYVESDRSNLEPQFFDYLQKQGIISETQYKKDLVCKGCLEHCIMPVEHKIVGGKSHYFIMCDKDAEQGRITIEPRELEYYNFTLSGVANWLAKQLKTDRLPSSIEGNSIFYLGKLELINKSYDLIISNNDSFTTESNKAVKALASPFVLYLVIPDKETLFPSSFIEAIISENKGGLACYKITLEDVIDSRNKQKPKGKSGAKEKFSWDAIRQKFDKIIEHYGLPSSDEPELKNQAALEIMLVEWCENRFGIDNAPAQSTIRRYVSKWLKEKDK